MKPKILSLVLAFSLALSLSACSNAADGSTSLPPEPSEQTPEPAPSTSSLPQDDRGIPGMKASTIRFVLESAFGVPWTLENIKTGVEADYCYSSCSSSGSDNDSVTYDYSISMDADGEIIGASFGLSANLGTSEQDLLLAADLYFYTVVILPYDTSDEETITTWFEDELPYASSDGTSTTIGDATFTLYGIPGGSYWVDISKYT